MRRAARPHVSAFTLIELLVVIAIIAVLAAILFPVFAQAREKARQSSCLSNMKQIGLGFMQYVQDYDEAYPGMNQQAPPVNGGTAWDRPFDSVVSPYVKNDQVYQCPSDDNYDRLPATSFGYWDGGYRTAPRIRSYQYVGRLNTAQANGNDANTGVGGAFGPSSGHALADLDATSETILLVEGWTKFAASASYLSSINSSAFVGCDTWKLAGRKPGSSAPDDQLPPGCDGLLGYPTAPGHAGGANYAFADGSAKWLPWGKLRKNDFYLFKLRKPTQTFTP